MANIKSNKIVLDESFCVMMKNKQLQARKTIVEKIKNTSIDDGY